MEGLEERINVYDKNDNQTTKRVSALKIFYDKSTRAAQTGYFCTSPFIQIQFHQPTILLYVQPTCISYVQSVFFLIYATGRLAV